MSNNISQGYKQTELGIIPEEWAVRQLGDCVNVYDGTHQTPNYVPVGIPFYSVENVTANNFSHTKHISPNEHKILTSRYKIQKGDILMTRIGSIGVCKYVDWDVDASFYVSLALLKPYNIDALYLSMASNATYFKDSILLNSLQFAIPQKINLGNISNVKILVPPIAEQRAIAEALSDVDGLIAALDKKIAKKRLLKQGAMQQLLTGKKRLPGFTDEWKYVALEHLLEYEQPTKYLVQSTDYIESGTPVLTAGKTFILGYTAETKGIYTNLPVIIFDDFTTDSKYVTMPFKAKSSAMKMLQLKDRRYNLRLVYELMQLIQFPLYDHQRYWISEYSKLQVYIPSNFKEQQAIATILSDMDKEIADLEAQRDKYRLLKSGMMQKLLTGQIRLKTE